MIIVLLRLVLFPLTTLMCSLLGLIVRGLGFGHSAVYRVFLLWRWLQHKIMNVEVISEGEIPQHGAIIMANHRSYLDIIMIPSLTPVVYVAKASVRKWPIVGWGGDAMRTIWVDRGNKESRNETRNAIMDRLEEDLSVIVYPEGTTSVGPGVLDFKPGMFHAIAGSDLSIIPVAIEYENPKIAWVGDDLFIPHFLREFRSRKTRVKVAFGEPVSGEDGAEIRTQVQGWIEERTRTFRKEWDEGRS